MRSNSQTDRLLRQMELNQRNYAWAHTEEAKNGTNEPQPMLLAGEEEGYESAVEAEERNALDVAELLGLRI